MSTDTESLVRFIEHLSEQIAVGELPSAEHWPETVPNEWWTQPEVEKLLRIARVQRGFAHNQVQPPIRPSAPAQVGKWRILRLLGQGGMGEVYLGERTDSAQHLVAIKCVRSASPHLAQRLTQELRVLAKLGHANIAHFIDAGIDATGMPWLALEYVDGITIARWCRERGSSLRERLQLFLKVCGAVAHAHRHLIVHRDIKPDNILVNQQGEPKLLDFGISKLLDVGPRETTVNSLTTSYAAPEQLEHHEIATTTDVYALGLLLFELLSGSQPATRAGQSLAQVLQQLHQEEHQRPSQTQNHTLPYATELLKGDLDAVVGKALRYRPEQRYGSVPEFAADIERFLAAQPVLARTPSVAYRVQRLIQRNKLASAFFLSAVLALCVGSGLALWQAREAVKQRNTALSAAETSNRVSAFAFSILRELNPQGRTSGTPKSAGEIVRESIERARKELADEPQARAMLLSKLGEIQSIIDSPTAAESAVQEALELRLQDATVAPLELATAQQALATIRVQQGRWDEAEALTLQTLPVFAAEPKMDRYHTMAYATLALIARSSGRTELAVERLAKAHSLALLAYGADAPNTIEMQGNRAILLTELARDTEAKALLLHTIAEFERTQGKNFARLIGPLATLAQVQMRSGEFNAALQNYARMDQIGRAQLGVENHQYVRLSLMYAHGLIQLKSTDEAERLLSALKPGQFQSRANLAFDYALLCARTALLGNHLTELPAKLDQAQQRLTILGKEISDRTSSKAEVQLAILQAEYALHQQRLDDAASHLGVPKSHLAELDAEDKLHYWIVSSELQMAQRDWPKAEEFLQYVTDFLAAEPSGLALWRLRAALQSANLALSQANRANATMYLQQALALRASLPRRSGWQRDLDALEFKLSH